MINFDIWEKIEILGLESLRNWGFCSIRLKVMKFVRLNLINHVLALFCDKFACNTALRIPVFRWESCKGSV